ncbi:hypothetical protein, partial [Nonomuraea mesophila]|uniref:hypothetical protein n=1 Tax=Nonomuraea mesophila TaxID=2530382 RepID=UPI0014094CBF
ADPPVTTAAGLPKRQSRHAGPGRPAPVTQQAITDTLAPEDAAAGLERMRQALDSGYAADPQGHTQP